MILNWGIYDDVLSLLLVSSKIRTFLYSLVCVSISEDELLIYECILLDVILMLCSWVNGSGWYDGKLKFIKLALICSSDWISSPSIRLCWELPHLIHNMSSRDRLVCVYSLLGWGRRSTKRKRFGERERLIRFRELFPNLRWSRSRELCL